MYKIPETKKTILKQIYDVLKQNGFDVYFPSQHKGECLSEYVVIKYAGTVNELNVSSERPIYDFLCYVPLDRYSILEQYIYDIKEVLKQLYPLIGYLGNEITSYYDEDVRAHMVSFQYQGIRKIYNWR
uniref:Tail completion protein n=1 Tax=Dulem virus 36 TaxID=3145754 RepID=A0AAU8AYR1_9CAUD